MRPVIPFPVVAMVIACSDPSTGPPPGGPPDEKPLAVRTELTKLLPPDGSANDGFGRSVALLDDVALVGAVSGDTPLQADAGAAYVFRFTGDAWMEEAKLFGSLSFRYAAFGSGVSLGRDVALIGAGRNQAFGYDAGAAYVFQHANGVWKEEATLLGDRGDWLGMDVSLSGDVLLLGAMRGPGNNVEPGSAHLFRYADGVWTKEAKLLPSLSTYGDRFGRSVALSGDVAVVSASRDSENGLTPGSVAYVFRYVDGVWEEEARLLASRVDDDDRYGWSVAVSGDVAVVGAPGGGGTYQSGAAYVFRYTGGTWREEAELLAARRVAGDHFGYVVTVHGNVVLIGAPRDDDNGIDSGSVSVFRYADGLWTEVARLLPSDGAAGDLFGVSAAVWGDMALVGATMDDDKGTDSGSVYLFRIPLPT